MYLTAPQSKWSHPLCVKPSANKSVPRILWTCCAHSVCTVVLLRSGVLLALWPFHFHICLRFAYRKWFHYSSHLSSCFFSFSMNAAIRVRFAYRKCLHYSSHLSSCFFSYGMCAAIRIRFAYRKCLHYSSHLSSCFFYFVMCVAIRVRIAFRKLSRHLSVSTIPLI